MGSLRINLLSDLGFLKVPFLDQLFFLCSNDPHDPPISISADGGVHHSKGDCAYHMSKQLELLCEVESGERKWFFNFNP